MILKPRLKHQILTSLVVVAAILLVGGGFWFAWQFVEPAPPDHLRIATGSKSGAYYRYALAYQKRLANNGITLDIVTSEGSVENTRRLLAGQVDVAFVQGGVALEAGRNGQLQSLGSMYFEPLWVFVNAQPPQRLPELGGKRLAIGATGSGSRALALELLQEAGLDDPATRTRLLPLGGDQARDALLAQRIDALFYVGSVQAPLVQALLAKAPQIQAMSFTRAEALSRRHAFLSVLRLPEGVLNLDTNLPDHDIQLVAATANLVTKPGLHPALVDLLLQAASAEHRDSGIFSEPGSFPQPRYLGFPLNEDAARYYKHGPPFLQRFLPFWAASLIDRLKVMLLPLLALMIPLFKIMPPALRLPAILRINKWYKELQAIDEASRIIDADDKATVETSGQLHKRLKRLREEIQPAELSPGHARLAYDLLQHIDWLDRRISSDKDPIPNHDV